jgi:aminopeptidase N
VALPNLTRDQAVERAALITVGSYQISLDVTDGSDPSGAPGERTSQTFRSTTTVLFDALAGADTVIDIAADNIRSASLNGRELDVSGYDESTGIPLCGLANRNVVFVDADCRYSNTGEGLHRFVDPVDNETYLYSQFETADAKRVFACFDQPDLKATFELQVIAPKPTGKTPTPTNTERSRWASTAGPRWRTTWTPSGCSPKPNRDLASTTRTLAYRTHSESTTSCSSPNSTPAQWKTPAR